MARVLVIDDEESIRFSFKTHLMNEAHEVMTAEDYSSGMEAVTYFKPDLVITDIILGGHTGIDILRNVKDMGMQCPVILITGEPNIETATESMHLGAFDYLPKPIRKKTLLRVTSHAIRHKELMDDQTRAENENVGYRLSQDAIFKSIKDAIVTVDNNMLVLEANKKIKNICGFSSEKLIGKHITEINAPCNKSCLFVLKEILKTKKSISEFRSECFHHDHPNQIVLLTGSPLKDHEDNVLGAILLIRNITRILEYDLKDQDAAFS